MADTVPTSRMIDEKLSVTPVITNYLHHTSLEVGWRNFVEARRFLALARAEAEQLISGLDTLDAALSATTGHDTP